MLFRSTESVSVFSQTVQVQRAVVPSVQLGPIQAQSVPVMVVDLRRVEEGFGVRIDAIIGLDVLIQSSFTIDYRSKKIFFGPVKRSGAAAQFHVQYKAGAPYVVVPVDVNDHTFRLLLDTGARDLILFEARVWSQLGGLRAGRTEITLTAAGEERRRELQLPDVRLGKTGFGKRKGFLWDIPAYSLRELDGLVGPASLGLRRIAFDFEHRTLTWER